MFANVFVEEMECILLLVLLENLSGIVVMYSLVMLDALEEGRVLFPLVGQEGMHLLSQ